MRQTSWIALAIVLAALMIAMVASNGVAILTTGNDGDSTQTQSPSGLEEINRRVTLLRGCADGQVLVWDETSDRWQCSDSTGGGHTIQDEGISLPARTRLNFIGAGVTCADDAVNDQTDCSVPGAGGGGAIVVQENDVTVSTAADTLDVGTGFDATESPTGEVNISWDSTEIASTTWGAGTDYTWTFDVSGATDPSMAFSAGTVNVTGTLQQGGTPVVLTTRTLTGGSGIAAIGDLSSDRTIAVDSTEPGFLADGGVTSLTCGAGNSGRMQVMDDGTLQWCDGAATSVLRTVGGLGPSVDDTELTAEDFGLFSCSGAEDGCAPNPDAITLGTHTTGNYVASLSCGATLTGCPSAGEGTSGTLSVATDSITSAHIDETDSYTWTGLHDMTSGRLRIPSGAMLPSTCSIGQVFFLTSAVSGQNVYGCTAVDTWTLEGDGGGGGGGTSEWIDEGSILRPADATDDWIRVSGATTGPRIGSLDDTSILLDPDNDGTAEMTIRDDRISLPSSAGVPTSPAEHDMWANSRIAMLQARLGGVTVGLLPMGRRIAYSVADGNGTAVSHVGVFYSAFGSIAGVSYDADGARVQYNTGTVAGDEAGFANATGWRRDLNPLMQARLRLPDTTSVRMYIGFCGSSNSVCMSSDNVAAEHAMIRYSTVAGDTQWVCVSRDAAGTQQVQSIGVSVDTSSHVFTVYMDADGAVVCGVDDTYVVNSVNIPSASTTLSRTIIGVETQTSAARSLEMNWMMWISDR